MADKKITELTAISSVDASTDVLEIVDVSDNESKKTTRNTLLGITGSPVGTSDTQTLTNKTLTSPTVTTPTLTVLDSALTVQDNADATKQLQLQLSGISTGTTRTLTVPDANTTVVGTDTTQTLTNKTLTAPTITNPTLTTDTVSEFTAANGVNVDGLNIKDGKLNTNNSVVTANITDASVTNAKLAANTAWSSWSPTWTNLTVGNGTVASRYSQIGKMVLAEARITFGSTSSISGSVSVSLPVSANSRFSTGLHSSGEVLYLDSGTNVYTGQAYINASATTATLAVVNVAGTYASQSALSSTVPFTWTTSDEISALLIYEAA